MRGSWGARLVEVVVIEKTAVNLEIGVGQALSSCRAKPAWLLVVNYEESGTGIFFTGLNGQKRGTRAKKVSEPCSRRI